MVRIANIDWSRTNHSHVTKHGMSPGDIEDIVFSSDYKPLLQKARDGRYQVLGRTSTGDYATVFVEPTEEKAFVVVCARLSSDAEKKRYKELSLGNRTQTSTEI